VGDVEGEVCEKRGEDVVDVEGSIQLLKTCEIMSFPKNNLYIIMVDFPLNEFKLAKIIFLPLLKNKKYFPENKLYLKICDLPECVKKLMKPIFNKLSKTAFLFLQDDSSTSHLEQFEKCLKTQKNKNILRWIKLIERMEKKKKTPALSGKSIYMSAFLLNYAVSEYELKKQLRCLVSQ
jgi:hypothetical protein